MAARPRRLSTPIKLNVAIDTIDSVSFSDYYFGRYGMEPKVQSTIAVTESGIAGPVKGANGVYVVNVDSRAPKAEVDGDAIRMQLEQGYRSKMRAVSQILKDNAKITDQRNKFF